MSKNKPGDWWDASWSVVSGCSWPAGKTPAACENCWASALAKRFPVAHGGVEYDREYPPNKLTTPWSTIICHEDRLDIPLKRKKPTIYACSLMGDLFHPDVPDKFIFKVFTTVQMSSNKHQFVYLTKRYKRATELISIWHQTGWYDNQIMMASVWDQDSCDDACKAFSRLHCKWGLHVEPMLDSVSLEASIVRALNTKHWPEKSYFPSWVVVGGETGQRARPMHSDWILAICSECVIRGIPFWFKSHGGRNKKKAGRMLDGKEWNQTPW